MAGKLSIVATPIGNMGDMTLRGIEMLRTADIIACEDTRVSKKLLNHYDITGAQLVRYDAHSTAATRQHLVNKIIAGNRVALVTDAGTPGLSDPGGELVHEVRTQVGDSAVEIIPGASAIVAALAACGVPVLPCHMYGFPPIKKGRSSFFEVATSHAETVIFFESTHRLRDACERLTRILPPERVVCLARELTKLHESVVRTSASELVMCLESDPNTLRGEHMIILAPLEFHL
jgi:16S rRNA (cytidine1402-2'-O)-methyltransferase